MWHLLVKFQRWIISKEPAVTNTFLMVCWTSNYSLSSYCAVYLKWTVLSLLWHLQRWTSSCPSWLSTPRKDFTDGGFVELRVYSEPSRRLSAIGHRQTPGLFALQLQTKEHHKRHFDCEQPERWAHLAKGVKTVCNVQWTWQRRNYLCAVHEWVESISKWLLSAGPFILQQLKVKSYKLLDA